MKWRFWKRKSTIVLKIVPKAEKAEKAGNLKIG